MSGFGLDVGHPDLIIDRTLLCETKTTDGGAYEPKTTKDRKPNPLAGQAKGVPLTTPFKPQPTLWRSGFPRRSC